MTTPFTPGVAAFQGVQPSQTPQLEVRSKRLWLGDPTSSYGMIELQGGSPSGGLSAPRSRGKVVKGLYGGGTSVLRFPNATRSWSYGWPTLSQRDYDLLCAFDDDEFGTPPWVLVEPEGVNRLTRAQSMCSGAGWTASSGTVTTSTASPVVTPCGVMQWATTSGSRLVAGSIVSTVGTPVLAFAVPNIPAEFLTFSAWVWLASGTGSIHARLTGCQSDGSSPSAVNGSSVAVGTNPVLVSVTAAPLAFGSLDWVLPVLVADSASTFLISNPQVSYTSCPMAWSRGGGCPRVRITSEFDRGLTMRLLSSTTLALAEAYPGAC